ncbi:MAG: hypothetical protein AMJ53_04710, partial [Gammaproteobacteria bacterium SG8_11]
MHYHVFLSYNSHDQSEASLIFQYLKDSNYKTFFEKDALKPGDIWQKKIEDALLSSDVIIILLGSQGVGRWQEIESRIYQIISTQCIEEKKPIIPVYLPRVNEASDREKFPIFLKQFHEFRFKESIDNEIINLLTHLTCDTSSLNNYERPILSYQQDILLKNTTRCYNKNAEKYFETWKDIISPSLYAFADEVNKIKKTARILDVGCGP